MHDDNLKKYLITSLEFMGFKQNPIQEDWYYCGSNNINIKKLIKIYKLVDFQVND